MFVRQTSETMSCNPALLIALHGTERQPLRWLTVKNGGEDNAPFVQSGLLAIYGIEAYPSRAVTARKKGTLSTSLSRVSRIDQKRHSLDDADKTSRG